MPRVRIGLTGLACVFLLVLIAAALFGNQRRARHVTPEEPLAELGVTPGGAPTPKPSEVKPPVQETLVAPAGSPAPVIAAPPAATQPAPGPARTASSPAHGGR